MVEISTCYFWQWSSGILGPVERLSVMRSWKDGLSFQLKKSWQTTSCPQKAKPLFWEGFGVLTLPLLQAILLSLSFFLLALTKLLVIIDVFIQNKISLLYRFLSFFFWLYTEVQKVNLLSSTFQHGKLQHNQPSRVCTH